MASKVRRIAACIVLLSVVASNHVTFGETITALVGAEVLLPCQTEKNNSTLVQTFWKKDNGTNAFIVYSPLYGISYSNIGDSGRIAFRKNSLQDGSILINSSELRDDGAYSCHFTYFPTGSKEKTIRLTVLAISTNKVTAVLAQAGVSQVPVATCTAANGKPAADITWSSTLPGNYTSSQTTNDNGTITVTSQFNIAPNSSNNGQSVLCIISHSASNSTDNLTVQLSILCKCGMYHRLIESWKCTAQKEAISAHRVGRPRATQPHPSFQLWVRSPAGYGTSSVHPDPPKVTITGYDGQWSEDTKAVTLKCIAKANPPATSYSWQGLPDGLDSEHADVFREKVNRSMNGTWTCEATNSIGTGTGKLQIIIKEMRAENADPAETATSNAIISGAVVGVVLVGLVTFLTVLLIRKHAKPAEGLYINVPLQRKKTVQDPADLNSTYMGLNLGEQAVYSELQR
uniref:nectin-1-like isoform X1 n=1 Tax=Pristiophorus japonicus TaxID=55135 RepID=UPI00398EF304